MIRHVMTWARPGLVALLCAALAGCGSSGSATDKVGPSRDTTVLRLANFADSLQLYPAVQDFAEAVARRSGQRLRIKVVERYGAYAEDAEQQVVLGVAENDVDLGYVHTGVFDTFGVTSLQALSAPMLMRSYAVEREVLASHMAAAMLAGVERAGVAGVALLGDQMRRPFGVHGPLHGPGDYRGTAIAAYPSRVTDGALEALGARPSHLYGGPLNDELERRRVDGVERTPRSYVGNGSAPLAPYGVANVALWPQVLAVIINPDVLASLDDEQRRWLEQAAADAAGRSIERAEATEHGSVQAACESGTRFSRASERDLAALRARFERTYASLEADPQTRTFISRIRELDAANSPDVALSLPAGCRGRPPSAPELSPVSTHRLDGTWRWRISERDRRQDPFFNGESEPGDDIFTFRIRDGRCHAHIAGHDGSAEDHIGTVTVEGDELTIAWDEGRVVDRYRFRLDGNLLRVEGISGDRGDLFVSTAHPWRRLR